MKQIWSWRILHLTPIPVANPAVETVDVCLNDKSVVVYEIPEVSVVVRIQIRLESNQSLPFMLYSVTSSAADPTARSARTAFGATSLTGACLVARSPMGATLSGNCGANPTVESQYVLNRGMEARGAMRIGCAENLTYERHLGLRREMRGLCTREQLRGAGGGA